MKWLACSDRDGVRVVSIRMRKMFVELRKSS
jgi:hypothetical protein